LAAACGSLGTFGKIAIKTAAYGLPLVVLPAGVSRSAFALVFVNESLARTYANMRLTKIHVENAPLADKEQLSSHIDTALLVHTLFNFISATMIGLGDGYGTKEILFGAMTGLTAGKLFEPALSVIEPPNTNKVIPANVPAQPTLLGRAFTYVASYPKAGINKVLGYTGINKVIGFVKGFLPQQNAPDQNVPGNGGLAIVVPPPLRRAKKVKVQKNGYCKSFRSILGC
jgi:hypothetical protein